MTNSLLLIGKHVSTRRAFPNTGCRKDAAGRQKGGVSPSGVRQAGRSTSLWTMPRLAVSIVDILPTASVCTWDAKAKSWDFSAVARTVLSLVEEYLSGGCRSGLIPWPDRDGVGNAAAAARRRSPVAEKIVADGGYAGSRMRAPGARTGDVAPQIVKRSDVRRLDRPARSPDRRTHPVQSDPVPACNAAGPGGCGPPDEAFVVDLR